MGKKIIAERIKRMVVGAAIASSELGEGDPYPAAMASASTRSPPFKGLRSVLLANVSLLANVGLVANVSWFALSPAPVDPARGVSSRDASASGMGQL